MQFILSYKYLTLITDKSLTSSLQSKTLIKDKIQTLNPKKIFNFRNHRITIFTLYEDFKEKKQSYWCSVASQWQLELAISTDISTWILIIWNRLSLCMESQNLLGFLLEQLSLWNVREEKFSSTLLLYLQYTFSLGYSH